MSRIALARAKLDKLFGDVPVQSAPADRWEQIVRTVQTSKVFLPIERARAEIRGDIAAVRLDSCNDGRPLVLLLDRKFWERTLSKIKGGLLHVDGGKVYVRYPHKLKESVDHWLPNLIAAVCTDYLSVRARTADTIDYRKQNLEIRRTEGQREDERRLARQVKSNGEHPERIQYFGHQKLLQPFDDTIDLYSAVSLPKGTRPAGNGPDDEAGAVVPMTYSRGDAKDDGTERKAEVYTNDGGKGGI
jgi:hypothetical protein